MSRLFQGVLLWGELLEILSFLTLNEVYHGCACLNKAGFIVFLRERATRKCPLESLSKSRFLGGYKTINV